MTTRQLWLRRCYCRFAVDFFEDVAATTLKQAFPQFFAELNRVGSITGIAQDECTVGPGADRVSFSPDGNHLSFEARGLLWVEDPKGPGAALEEVGRVRAVLVTATGDALIYSVSTGDLRGTYRVDLRSVAAASVDPGGSAPWLFNP